MEASWDRPDAQSGTGADFQVDLANCAREPIHIPGAIQPHGALLVLHEPELTVLQVSENVASLLGIEADSLIGAEVDRVIGTGEADRLRDVLVGPDLGAVNPLRIQTAVAAGTARLWDGIVHRTEGGTVLELEPTADTADEPRSVSGLYGRVRGALARLQGATTLSDLCEVVAREVHRLTGLDRVTVYRFDPEWNGEVVAEVHTPGMDSFLGLHFPATDIPAQARELYRRNWLRLIADVGYRPARIVPTLNPETGRPLDLSGSALRSVSPIHLEYLRNMGVGASMSVSLLREGELWGLVACHHATPKYLAYELRSACEFLGQAFSVQLGAVAEDEGRGYELRVAETGARMFERIAAEDNWIETLAKGSPNLTELFACGGAAVWTGERCVRIGNAPAAEQIAELVGWLDAGGADLFHTDRLTELFPPAAGHADLASGLLAAAIGRGTGDYLLWFRPEVVRTVEWAGNPDKAVQVGGSPDGAADHADPIPRLHPRRSFAAWTETVRHRSQPWQPVEARAAAELRSRIVDVVLRQAERLSQLNEQLTQLNTELQRSNDELDAFTYIASHDLKEPLRGIHNFARMLREDEAGRLSAEGEQQTETLVRLSRRMDGMLGSLLDYSRAGKLDLPLDSHDLDAILREVLDTLAMRIREAGAEIRLPRPLPVVRCDPVRTGSVLQNLISNALKYNDKPDPWVEIGWLDPEHPDTPVVVYVRDNGIGIAREQWEAVFRIFKRLHARDKFGGGFGAGLTIARKLVERHGGRLWLESEPGRGSTFFFTLEG